MPAPRGVRGNPENLDRQAAKIQAAGSGEEGVIEVAAKLNDRVADGYEKS
jgi:hypothetical protein